MRTVFLMLIVAALGSASVQAQTAAALREHLTDDAAITARAVPSVVVAGQEGGTPADGIIPAAWRPRSTTLNWVDYALIAATGASAVVAIHYKFKADRLYDDYQETGDPSLRGEIRALDRRSGIAVVGMQAGVGIFAVRLLLR